MGPDSADSKPDFQMSEEEDYFLNVKRSLKNRLVKHSTPVDSMISRTMPSLTDLINWSAKDQDLSKRACVSPVPKPTLSSNSKLVSLASVEARITYTSPKRLSTMLDLRDSNREISESSQVIFSRRRLSTVLASDESNNEQSEKAVSSIESQTHTKASEKIAINPGSGPLRMITGIPGIKDPPVLKKKKKKIDKAIVRKKQREWVLRQLKNIEEATEHELRIEEA